MSSPKSKAATATTAPAASVPKFQIPLIPLTLPTFNTAPPSKFCSQCGKPVGSCSHTCNQSTTICITFDTTPLQTLVNMIPKIQITTNQCCSSCGHAPHTGQCPEPDCECGQ